MLTIFVLQLLFQLFRVLSTRFVVNGSILATSVTTLILQALWLITTAIGVQAVVSTDWKTIAGYMIGGVIGNVIAMKYNIKELK